MLKVYPNKIFVYGFCVCNIGVCFQWTCPSMFNTFAAIWCTIVRKDLRNIGNLIPNIGRSIEKLIHNRLDILLETNNGPYENQFEFRKHRTTNHALESP